MLPARAHVLYCLAAAAALAATPVLAQQQTAGTSDPGPLAITNVTVVDIDSGTLRPDHTVLVRDGRITFVGPSSAVEAPADARRIDGSRQYVIPGLIDMHAHASPADFPLHVAGGVTSLRIMAGNAQYLRMREQVRSGELLGPDLLVAGPIIDGRPPPGYPSIVATGRRYVSTAAEAALEVERQHAAGYDFLKIYNHLAADAYEGLVQAAGERGLDVIGHVPFAVSAERAMQAQRTVEHRGGFLRLLAWQHADTLRIPEVARNAAAAGVWFCPTFVIDHILWPSSRVMEYLTGRHAPLLSTFWRDRLMDRRRLQWASNFTEADFAAADHMYAVKRQLVRALHEAGAPLCAGSDAWPPAGFSLHDELRVFVGIGIAPGEALRTATLSAARAMRRDDRGDIVAGARADLVLLDANPLDDIEAIARPLGVVLNGRWLPRETLDSLIESVVASNRRLIVSTRAGTDGQRTLAEGALPTLSRDGRTVFFLEADRASERHMLWRSPQPGRTIYATTRLMAVASGGSTPRVIASGVMAGGDFEPTYDVSPDGRSIVFAGFADDSTPALLRVAAAGGAPRVLQRFAEPKTVFPRWSPNGRQIAYADSSGVFLLPAGGGVPRRLSTISSPGAEVQWSPNGRSLAVVGNTDRDDAFALHVIDVAAGVGHRVTPESEDGRYKDGIRWHPDGRRISYMVYGNDDSAEQVRIANADGSGTELLVDVPDQWDWYGSWSPDGRRFVFRSYTHRWVLIELDGATSTMRSFGAGLSVPSWSRNGKLAVWSVAGDESQ